MSSEGFTARGSHPSPASAPVHHQGATSSNWPLPEHDRNDAGTKTRMFPSMKSLSSLLHHPWHEFYLQDPANLDEAEKNAAIRAANAKTLNSVFAFRLLSDTIWRYDDAIPRSETPRIWGHREMKTIRTVEPDAPTALFIVVKKDNDSATLRPVHKEIVGCDRPDLHMVKLDRHAIDLTNDGGVNPNEYFIGDVIEVVNLVRMANTDPRSSMKSFGTINSPELHRFWRIGKFRLLERTILVDRPLYVGFNHSDESYVCFAESLEKPVIIHEEQLQNFAPSIWLLTDIFIPAIQPGRLLSTIDPRYLENVLEGTQMVTENPLLFPIAIKLKPFPERAVWKAGNALSALESSEGSSYKSGCKTLSFSLRIGLTGILAMENLSREPCNHLARVDDVHPIRGDHVSVRFRVEGSNADAKSKAWSPGTIITIKTRSGLSCQAVIVSTDTKSPKLAVTVEVKDCAEFRQNKQIIVSHPFLNNRNLLDLLPTSQELQRLPSECNGRRILEALNGGQRITGNFSLDKHRTTAEPGIFAVFCRYIEAITNNKCPAFAFNTSPPGHLPVVAAAAQMIRGNPLLRTFQLIICPDPAEIYSVIDEIESRQLLESSDYFCVFSKNHYWESIDGRQSTSEVYSRMTQVLRNFVADHNDRLRDSKKVNQLNLLGECLYHLHRDNMIPNNIDSSILNLRSEKKPTRSMFEIYLELDSPGIIVATPNSAIEFFKRVDLDAAKIKMVQITRARRIPRHSILSLVCTFFNAQFAFFNYSGDHEAEWPECLPQELADCAAKNIIDNSSNCIPHFDF